MVIVAVQHHNRCKVRPLKFTMKPESVWPPMYLTLCCIVFVSWIMVTSRKEKSEVRRCFALALKTCFICLKVGNKSKCHLLFPCNLRPSDCQKQPWFVDLVSVYDTWTSWKILLFIFFSHYLYTFFSFSYSIL